MPDDAVFLIEQWLRAKYVVRADPRQREMGLSYITAETNDLAHNIGRLLQALTEMTALYAVDRTPLAALDVALEELTETYVNARR